MTEKFKASSEGNKELEKSAAQIDSFNSNVKDLVDARRDHKPDVEPQTKMSVKQQQDAKDVYLKPDRVIGRQDKFNEKFRDSWNFDKEYVKFIAENREIIGEVIEMWTAPYGGVPAEFWKVPTNKPVWGPRYLAEQIKRKYYHRLIMEQTVVGADHAGQYYGSMAVDTTVQRMDAYPVSDKKSFFMGKNF
jgi:hypothetical protein